MLFCQKVFCFDVILGGGISCSNSLAGDASTWWEPGNLFGSQKLDHIQKVRFVIFGLHHLDYFCEGREHYCLIKKQQLFEFVFFLLELRSTFHFHINMFLKLCLLLQRLLCHLGGAREADDDDAHVIQAALQRETEISEKSDTRKGLRLNKVSYYVIDGF